MLEITVDNAIDYLKSTERLAEGDVAHAELLAWGVSNFVLRICVRDAPDFVLKQSRAQLRTQADWFSRLDRVWRESDVMNVLQPLLPAGVVPQILFEDRDNYLFAMEAVDAGHIVWKAALLEGTTNDTIARQLGEYLATIHRQTANDDHLRERLGDTAVFSELRIDPFYRRISEVHPDLAGPVQRVIDEALSISACVVHADFSPKNILVTSQGLSLVDFETGHYGDPAFDLGFFLSHLLLKTVLWSNRADEFLQMATTFWQTYLAGIEPITTWEPFSRPEFERRSLANLAACMLSRIDGKSTVDYLSAEAATAIVRPYCRELLLNPPLQMDEAFARLKTLLN